jgi:hypothetical protein
LVQAFVLLARPALQDCQQPVGSQQRRLAQCLDLSWSGANIQRTIPPLTRTFSAEIKPLSNHCWQVATA